MRPLTPQMIFHGNNGRNIDQEFGTTSRRWLEWSWKHFPCTGEGTKSQTNVASLTVPNLKMSESIALANPARALRSSVSQKLPTHKSTFPNRTWVRGESCFVLVIQILMRMHHASCLVYASEWGWMRLGNRTGTRRQRTSYLPHTSRVARGALVHFIHILRAKPRYSQGVEISTLSRVQG
jgi:hypothetical protein